MNISSSNYSFNVIDTGLQLLCEMDAPAVWWSTKCMCDPLQWCAAYLNFTIFSPSQGRPAKSRLKIPIFSTNLIPAYGEHFENSAKNTFGLDKRKLIPGSFRGILFHGNILVPGIRITRGLLIGNPQIEVQCCPLNLSLSSFCIRPAVVVFQQRYYRILSSKWQTEIAGTVARKKPLARWQTGTVTQSPFHYWQDATLRRLYWDHWILSTPGKIAGTNNFASLRTTNIPSYLGWATYVQIGIKKLLPQRCSCKQTKREIGINWWKVLYIKSKTLNSESPYLNGLTLCVATCSARARPKSLNP